MSVARAPPSARKIWSEVTTHLRSTSGAKPEMILSGVGTSASQTDTGRTATGRRESASSRRLGSPHSASVGAAMATVCGAGVARSGTDGEISRVSGRDDLHGGFGGLGIGRLRRVMGGAAGATGAHGVSVSVWSVSVSGSSPSVSVHAVGETSPSRNEA